MVSNGYSYKQFYFKKFLTLQLILFIEIRISEYITKINVTLSNNKYISESHMLWLLLIAQATHHEIQQKLQQN